MNRELEKILSLEEKSTIEFKTGKDKIPSSLFETYSAFANTNGGTIYLGIKENDKPPHSLEGVINAKQKRKQLFDIFNNKEKVSYSVIEESDIEILSFDEGDIIKITVHEADRANKPVYINGNIANSYGRKDSGDYKLSEEKIQSLINDKNEQRFDQKPNTLKIGIEDLDQESLNTFIQLVHNAGKIPASSSLSIETILQRIGAIVRNPLDGKYVLNNGAILFFGKTPDVNSICPNLWLDYTYTSETDEKWGQRITNKDLSFEGNIFQFYYRTVNEILSNSPSPHLLEGVQDIGKRLVGEIIREASANAISNLDLFDQYGLKIRQTSKDIVFDNAGTMIVPLETALLGGTSKPRNPTLFSFFLAIGVSDHGGYGIPSIYDSCKKLNFIPPTLIEDKENAQTKLIISFRKKDRELSKDELAILNIVSKATNGLSIQEIIEQSSFGRDKTRKIVENLSYLNVIKSNDKPTKGKKYFRNN